MVYTQQKVYVFIGILFITHQPLKHVAVLLNFKHILVIIEHLLLTHWGQVIHICVGNENLYISLQILLKFVYKVWIDNIPALVPIMAW